MVYGRSLTPYRLFAVASQHLNCVDKYFVVAVTAAPEVSHYLADQLFLAGGIYMNIPPHTFLKRDGGPIKDWWQARIYTLIDTDNEDAARALYKEFHLGLEGTLQKPQQLSSVLGVVATPVLDSGIAPFARGLSASNSN